MIRIFQHIKRGKSLGEGLYTNLLYKKTNRDLDLTVVYQSYSASVRLLFDEKHGLRPIIDPQVYLENRVRDDADRPFAQLVL